MLLKKIGVENMTNLELIMLVGVPGCGKSTWIENNNLVGYSVISMDNIIEELGAPEGLPYSEAFDKYSGVAARKMKEQLKEALKNRENIIWDQTNLTVKSRTKKLKVVPDDYNKIAVVFEISGPELERRRTIRENTSGKVVPAFVLQRMQVSYACPTKSEGFNEIKIITS